MVVLVGIVFLVVGEEIVELETLPEVLDGFDATDVLQEVEVSVDVDTCADEAVPVDGLQLHI